MLLSLFNLSLYNYDCLCFYFLRYLFFLFFFFFFSSRRRHTRCLSDWSSDVCSSDLSIFFWARAWANVRGFSCGCSSPFSILARSPAGSLFFDPSSGLGWGVSIAG